MITELTKEKIKQHAYKELPRECCGLVLDNGDIFECQNQSSDNQTFQINPKDFLKASLKGEITAYYHSHNKEAELSFLDRINLKHGYKSIIYSVKTDNFVEFDENQNISYLGREFKIGVNDCYSLVKDFYKQELNINLPEYPRGKDWYIKNPNVIENHVNKSEFRIVKDFKLYDIIICKSEDRHNIPCHFLIYLGNNQILHHPRNGLSKIDLLEQFLDSIVFHLRHESQ